MTRLRRRVRMPLPVSPALLLSTTTGWLGAPSFVSLTWALLIWRPQSPETCPQVGLETLPSSTCLNQHQPLTSNPLPHLSCFLSQSCLTHGQLPSPPGPRAGFTLEPTPNFILTSERSPICITYLLSIRMALAPTFPFPAAHPSSGFSSSFVHLSPTCMPVTLKFRSPAQTAPLKSRPT